MVEFCHHPVEGLNGNLAPNFSLAILEWLAGDRLRSYSGVSTAKVCLQYGNCRQR